MEEILILKVLLHFYFESHTKQSKISNIFTQVGVENPSTDCLIREEKMDFKTKRDQKARLKYENS